MSTALMTEKIAVFAPMPSASVNTATNVNTGCLSSTRAPKRRSCQNVPISSSTPQRVGKLSVDVSAGSLVALALNIRGDANPFAPCRAAMVWWAGHALYLKGQHGVQLFAQG